MRFLLKQISQFSLICSLEPIHAKNACYQINNETITNKNTLRWSPTHDRLRLLTAGCCIISLICRRNLNFFFLRKPRDESEKKTNPMPISAVCLLSRKKKSPTILQLMKSHFGNFTFVYNPTWTAEIFCFFLFSWHFSHMIQKLAVGWRKRHWVASSGATRFRVVFGALRNQRKLHDDFAFQFSCLVKFISRGS